MRYTPDTHRKPTDYVELPPESVVELVHADHGSEKIIGVRAKAGRRVILLLNTTNFIGSERGTVATFYIRKRRGGQATARAYILRDFTIPPLTATA